MQKETLFKVPSTGIKIKTVPFNLVTLARQVRKRMERQGDCMPQPPQVEVKIGKSPALELDPNDMNYRRELIMWQQRLGERCMDAVMARLAQLQEFSDERAAEIAEFKEQTGNFLDFEDDDRLNWLLHIAVGSDVMAVYDFVTGKQIPTEEGIQAEAENFQD